MASIPNKYSKRPPIHLRTTCDVCFAPLDMGICTVEPLHQQVPDNPMPVPMPSTPSHLAGGNGIGWAVARMWEGEAVVRKGWNGKYMYLKIQVPDEQSANTLPYVWIRTAQGERVPWLASQTDLLARDWEMVQ